MRFKGLEALREYMGSTESVHSGTILAEDNSHNYLRLEREPEPTHGPVVTKRKKGTRLSREASTQNLLAHLQKLNGRKTDNYKIGNAIGVQDGYVSTLLTPLLKAGIVSRTGKRGHYRYQVHLNASALVSNKLAAPKRGRGSDATERIYDYIKLHEDIPVTQETIATMTGMHPNTVHRLIKQLVAEKKIVASEPDRLHGTRYWLYESIQEGPKEQPKPEFTKTPETVTLPNTTRLVTIMDGLAWEFIKETNSTNVVDFVNWLKTKNEL